MNYDYGLIRIFGPSIFKVKIPNNLLNHLNKFIDNTIEDKEQSKNLDVGKGLVGDVKQEFRLDKKTVEESGWLKFLGDSVAQWIYKDTGKKISEFKLIENIWSSWVSNGSGINFGYTSFCLPSWLIICLKYPSLYNNDIATILIPRSEEDFI